jgi:hypothetical protein
MCNVPTDRQGEMEAMNDAFRTLIALAIRYDLPAFHDRLMDGRDFMTRMIDARRQTKKGSQ